jgi:hypothetical protein
MSHAVTAALPSPINLPTRLASGPVTTTATALAASRSSISNVTPRRSGIVFQTGRPSSTSQIRFDARMKAPM